MATLRIASGLAVVVCLASSAVALAQSTEPIATDRPDFTESAGVVGTRVVQVESGVLWEQDDTGGQSAKQLSLPNTLVRLGMTSRLEFRTSFQGLVRQRAGGPRSSWQSSASDLVLGGKYQLARQEGLGLDVALLADVSLPTGGAASSGNADPTVKLAWARDVGSFSLSGNVNAASVTNEDDRRERVLEGTLSVGHPLWGAWAAFLEGVASTIHDLDSVTAWTADTGVTRLLGNDAQLDVYLGRGLNDAATNWAFGAGVSFRFRR